MNTVSYSPDLPGSITSSLLYSVSIPSCNKRCLPLLTSNVADKKDKTISSPPSCQNFLVSAIVSLSVILLFLISNIDNLSLIYNPKV